jgi:dTDP-glucose pyrophosphorylase
MKAVIPAAGLGTRLLPATKSMPKEMLPVVDKPVIQYVVEEAAASGIEDILIITGRGKRAIEDHFDVSYELEHQIQGTGKEKMLDGIRDLINRCTFSYTRQIQMRGLGHAILSGRTLVGDEPFGVVLADDLQHSLGRDLLRIVMHAHHVAFEVGLDLSDAWKPFQGFFDHVGSVGSGDVEPLGHLGNADRDPAEARGKRLPLVRVRPLAAAGQQQQRTGQHDKAADS